MTGRGYPVTGAVQRLDHSIISEGLAVRSTSAEGIRFDMNMVALLA